MSLAKSVPGPRTFPIIGNLYLYKFGKYKVDKYHEVLVSLHREFGPLVRQQLGPVEIIHVFEPGDVEKIHSREGPTPFVHPLQATVQQYRKMRKTSPGLGNTNGEEWYRLRSAIRQMVLRPQSVQTYLPAFNKIADDFMTRLRGKLGPDGQISNLRMELSKWSNEGWVAFGQRLGNFSGGAEEMRAERLIDANKIVFKTSAKLKFSLHLHQHISTPSWKRLFEAENLIYGIQEELITSAMRRVENGKTEMQDSRMLQYLFSRKELTKDDVTVLLLSIFTDSLSTTVPTLMCSLHCLAAHPEIQEEVHLEIKAAAKNGELTAENLQEMPLLKATIKEVFRMFPNGIETDRILQTDHELSGYHLPPGTHITTNQIVHFRSEKYFENPHHFNPHRWLKGGPPVHNFLLLPFGYGSRSCAGRRIAEQDLYVAVAKILSNFRLSVPQNQNLELIFETLLFPKEPLGIRFYAR